MATPLTAGALWVIPCKFDPIVFRCVDSIREHHPGARILVVDGCSPDISYLAALDAETTGGNRNHSIGAFRWAVEHVPADFYYLFHDSLIVHDNLDDLRDHDLTTVRWFQGYSTGWGRDADDRALEAWAADRGVNIPAQFPGVFGPMIAASRETIERADLFRIMPTSRYDVCALERIWGIWLLEAGYDATCSLQGEMVDDIPGIYPTDRVEKFYLGRA